VSSERTEVPHGASLSGIERVFLEGWVEFGRWIANAWEKCAVLNCLVLLFIPRT